MDLIAVYTTIANWAGWPIVFTLTIIIGSIGYWLLNNRISLLQEHKEYLSTQLNDVKNFQPDIVAQRLAERHKLLQATIESLNEDVIKNKTEIDRLEKELAISKKDAEDLSSQLYDANHILQGVLPRQGIISPIILSQFIYEIRIHGAIFLLVWIGSGFATNALRILGKDKAYSIKGFRGMHKFRLRLTASEEQIGGDILNPFEDSIVYDNDFYETLALLLSPFDQKEIGDEKYNLPVSVEFSMLDDHLEDTNNILILKIPMSLDDILRNADVAKELISHNITKQ